MVATCRRLLEQGIPVMGGVRWLRDMQSNWAFALRYMVDREIAAAAGRRSRRAAGGSGRGRRRRARASTRRATASSRWTSSSGSRSGSGSGSGSASASASASGSGPGSGSGSDSASCSQPNPNLSSDLVSHAPGEYMSIAPRVLSFDIECAGRRRASSRADKDPIIQITSFVTCQGSDRPIVRNVFTLKECAPISGAQVLSCLGLGFAYPLTALTLDLTLTHLPSAGALLRHRGRDARRLARFLVQTDPDVITGYNINNFDTPYLINRAEANPSRSAPSPSWVASPTCPQDQGQDLPVEAGGHA